MFSLCAAGLLRGAVSQPVLLEAQRNIALKRGATVLDAFYRLVVLTPLAVVAPPSKSEQRRYRRLVEEKDEHVIAAAAEAGAPFLLTLDKRLAERVNQGNLPVQALSPGEFIKTILPQHVEWGKQEGST